MTEILETGSLTRTDPYAETIDGNAVRIARKLRQITVPGFREGPISPSSGIRTGMRGGTATMEFGIPGMVAPRAGSTAAP